MDISLAEESSCVVFTSNASSSPVFSTASISSTCTERLFTTVMATPLDLYRPRTLPEEGSTTSQETEYSPDAGLLKMASMTPSRTTAEVEKN